MRRWPSTSSCGSRVTRDEPRPPRHRSASAADSGVGVGQLHLVGGLVFALNAGTDSMVVVMSPRRGPVSQAADAILLAAAQEFEQRGFTGASFAGVAARANVSKSLVAYHFPTKARMAEAVLACLSPDDVFPAFESAPGNPLDALLEAARNVAHAMEINPYLRAVLRLQTERDVIDADLPVPHVTWIRRVEDALWAARDRGLIPKSTEVHDQAILLVGQYVGVKEVIAVLGNSADLPHLLVSATADRLRAMGATEFSLSAPSAL